MKVILNIRIKFLKTVFCSAFLYVILHSSVLCGYPWPLQPTNQQGDVFSTLDECRGNRDHFHDAIDIDCDAGDRVYAVASGTANYFAGGDGLYVGRYGYAHTIPIVADGASVNTGDEIATVTSASHLHFMDGPDGSEINPLRSGGISPFVDTDEPNFYSPEPIKIYQNDSDGDYEDWQELSYNDVHGEVDIVVGVSDEITNGGDNAGLYSLGYEIWRLNEWGLWERVIGHYNFQFYNWLKSAYINYVYADGSNTSTFYYIPTNYMTGDSYLDTEAEITDVYGDGDYRLVVIAEDIKGNKRVKEECYISITVNNGVTSPLTDNIPIAYSLSQSYPNPFNLMTEIRYALPRRIKVEISVYNSLGQKVRSLVNEEKPSGCHSVCWDGKNELGQDVSSGVYYYRMRAGDFTETKRMILLK